ncbi:MAG TPA: hypothetical protein EYP49_17410 [Anaerolineae bacterium]|nr:hypothetical protein [Anaerolineae bacterium]
MGLLLRPLLSLYQNNRATINRAISATWLSSVVWLTLGALPFYPSQWRAVIAAGVLTVGLWTVEWAFYIAVLALLYPLYHISIYVMVLFLAVAVLLRPLIIAHFNQTLLVVTTPLLAQVHLEAVPALLAGLLWGAGSGMWVGGLAALWFKLLGGMCGLDIDLGALISSLRQDFAELGRGAQDSAPLSLSMVMDRFHTANSLETLQRLVEPFAPSSTVALSHLLQILAWGVAGYVVGGMVRRGRMDERGTLGRVICLVVGAALLSAGNLWVPVWLELRPETTNFDEVMAQVTPAVMNSLFAISVVALLDGCRRLLNRPLPQRSRRRRNERGDAERRARKQVASEGPKPLPLSHKIPEPGPSDQDDDIIMIELD